MLRRPGRDGAKTLAALALLQLALPVNAAVTGTAVLVGFLMPRSRRLVADRPRTILISGGKMTKALQLARSFHAAGHRVILVESAKYRWTGHRFSKAVDRFYIVPRAQDPGYANALLDIVRRESVDLYVPVCSPASSIYDAMAKPLLAPYCDVLHPDHLMVEMLDDKASFARTAGDLGLAAPETYRLTSPEQLRGCNALRTGTRFVLKSIPYDPVNRLDLTLLPLGSEAQTLAFARSKPIAADRPWIMQSFIAGQEFCAHATARHGHVQVYCCCSSSAFQLNYASVDHPAIEAWVTAFVGALAITGQVSFDFIQNADGEVFAIECNPRAHSAITMFYDQPDMARAYLEDDVPTLRPSPSSRPTYWTYNELWRVLSHPRTALERLRVMWHGKDAIFDLDDPLPFFMVHHLHMPSLLLHNLRRRKPWIRIDFNIGKLVEPGGD